MFWIYLAYLLTQILSLHCKCPQIHYKDKCEALEGCYYDYDLQGCLEIPCNVRERLNCSNYGNIIRCLWDELKNKCVEIQQCSQLTDHSITNSTSSELCLSLDCSWDFELSLCNSLQQAKSCTQYSSQVCEQSTQINGLEQIPCVLNGPQGNQCIPFTHCEHINYQQSCDSTLCKWDNGNCKTKKCTDYDYLTCPTMHQLSKEYCFPSELLCEPFDCVQFTQQIYCDLHPSCFWGITTSQCQHIDCALAIDATMCFSFYSSYGLQSCTWVVNECLICSITLLSIALVMILTIN